MLVFKSFSGFITVLFCAINGVLLKDIPDYIHVCKRDQSTIDDCVRKSIEVLRPKLASGIPELNVPSIEPFYIPEIVVDNGNQVQFQAIGKDVKVSGASNFTIKSLSVDLDTFKIRGRVRIPKLHFEGQYTLDARLLVLPLHGKGNIIADAMKCEAEIVLHSKIVEREGVEYIKFTKLEVDLNIKDYRLRLDGLFNGDKVLGETANEALNQNRAEFMKAAKPYAERTVAKLLLNIANKIAGSFPFDDLLPKA